MFYLGTHESHWLGLLGVPLFVSHRRLAGRRTLPRAVARWALDSGGFTELSRPPHRWVTTVDEYVEAVHRYGEEVGMLDWAAPMDWMCEPHVVQATGKTVAEHQYRTVENYLDLRDRGPFIPVLQGWTFDDYERCVGLYRDAGVDLSALPVVGLGSVCRRQATGEFAPILTMLRDEGIRFHGFGVKKTGLSRYWRLFESADSMAWSFDARRTFALDGCGHRSCANCSRYALRWYGEVLSYGSQLSLGADGVGGETRARAVTDG